MIADVAPLSSGDEVIFAFRRNVVVAASAGTGKTHRLAGLYVLLTLGLTSMGERAGTESARGSPPLSPERIVATTFSRDAAREMARRVERSLRALASGDAAGDPIGAVVAARAARLAEGPSPEEIRARAATALSRLSSARIDTLHGLAAGILAAHGPALGVPPGARILDEDEAMALAEAALDASLSEALRAGGDRAAAARALVAASGSLAMARRDVVRILDRLDEEGISPADLHLVDHGDDARRAARELATVARRCGVGASAALREAGAELAAELGDGEPLGAGRLTPSAARAARDLMTLRLPARAKRTDAEHDLAAFCEGLSGATKRERADRLLAFLIDGPTLGEREQRLRTLLDDAAGRLIAARRRAGALSYGDLLRAARRGVAEHADVAAATRAGIDALLVDEFQDSSRVQRDLVYLLREREDAAALRPAGSTPAAADLVGHGLFLVGDRKQSIYGFRGADVTVFCRVCTELAGPAAAEALALDAPGATDATPGPVADFVALRESRRSGERVLAFVNAFAERDFGSPSSPPSFEFDLRYAPSEHLVAAPRPAPPRRDAVVLVHDDGACPDDADPLVREASGSLREALVAAAFVAAEVARAGGNLAYREVAVLARRRSTIPLIELALTRLSVPYVVAGRALFDAREVRDVAAALRLLLDPRDRLALATVLRGPAVALSDGALAVLSQPGRGLTVPLLAPWREAQRGGGADMAAALARLERDDRARLETFRGRFIDLRRAALRMPAGDAVRAVVRAFDLDRALAALPRAEARIGNVDRLTAIARRRGGTLGGFVRWLDRRIADEADEAEAAVFSPEDDAVRLTTIHASKGLDFPVVVLVDLNAAPRGGSPGTSLLPPLRQRPATLAVRHFGSAEAAAVATSRTDDLDGAPHEATALSTRALRSAREEARAREVAERRRLTYVAMTRAREALVLVCPPGDPRSATTFATLALASTDPELAACVTRNEAAGALLDEAERVTARAAREAADAHTPPPPRRPAASPARTLAVATTPLSMFGGCARRFRLRHLLGLEEPLASGQLDLFGEDAALPASAEERGGEEVDPRELGRAAHRVLERWPADAWGRPTDPRDVLERLRVEGLEPAGTETARIAEGIARFLSGPWAARLRASGATLRREVPFVLGVELPSAEPQAPPRRLALRGAMDLRVDHPDGTVDVIDYKRSRPRADLAAYEFQLRTYALAARDGGAATRVRAGVLFLGAHADPVLLPGRGPDGTLGDEEHARFERHLGELAARLAEARWTGRYDGVAPETCRRLHCGFAAACHPPARRLAGSLVAQ